ncbi:Ig-like domain-containing protein [Brevibacillus sp. AY1]|uniref:Ig-like domain-containing protein n=1 Tax=Brevibacillus sp. AY1 TaxID=2807621 RepID=UPI002457DED0|nr:Ig-like domain-containing protein [Brevibacillus sp. AY1]MDH4619738.1 Ig-like domain-containing protein [Brevibacillus sp. AY1]
MGAKARKWMQLVCLTVLLLAIGFGSNQSALAKSDGGWIVSISPSQGAKEVATDTLIVMKFSETVTLKNKKPLTDKSVSTFVQLKNEKNKNVKFTAKWNKNNRTITIDPVGNLEEGQQYTVTLVEKKLMNGRSQQNPKVSQSFTTKKAVDRIAPQAIILPGNGAKKVKLQEKLTFQFVEDVVLTNGEALTSKNANTLVQIRDSKGNEVVYTSTWNKTKRMLTVKPKGGKWQPHTTYQVHVIAGKVEDLAANRNPGQSSSFSTGDR